MAEENLSPIFNQPGIPGFTFMRPGEKFPPIEEGWQKKGHSFDEAKAYRGNVGLLAGNGYGGLDQDDPEAFKGLILPETTIWETRPGRLGMWLKWSDKTTEVLAIYGFKADQAQIKLFDSRQVVGRDDKGKEIYKHVGEVKLERAYQAIPPSWKTLEDGNRVDYRILSEVPPAEISLGWILSELLQIGLRFSEKSREPRHINNARKLEETRVQTASRIGDMKDKVRDFLQQSLSNGTPGNRNEAGFWLACQLRDLGISPGEASEYMRDYARAAPKGDHPYTEKDAQKSLEQAYSQAPRDPPRSETARMSLADALLLVDDLKNKEKLKANPGLPFESRYAEALITVKRHNLAEYERVIAALKSAGISIRDLKKEVRHREDEVKAKSRDDKAKDSQTKASIEAGIQVNDRYLHEVSNEAYAALLKKNDPPQIFIRAGQLVRLVIKEHLVIDSLSKSALRGILSRATGFVTVDEEFGGNGEKKCTKVPPPIATVEDLLTLGSWPGLPVIEGITEAPMIRPDGSMLKDPGYDVATKLYYTQPDGLKGVAIPDSPSRDDAIKAAKFILDEIFVDFPFKDEASKANALALLVTIIARPAIDGCIPLALLDKPSPGTGASLLVEIAALIGTGRPANMMGMPETEDEMRKAITSALLEGGPMVVIDNVDGQLRSTTLTRALTSRIWSDRILGKSELADLPQRATWAATGNNLSLKGDLGRRSYWVRMDAEMARPWLRDSKEFRHPDILSWISENRADLLSKLLVMARAWFIAGKPDCKAPTIGGFKEWSQMVGGILEYAGIKGFLANKTALYDSMDEGVKHWDLFLGEWRDIHADTPITAGVLRGELLSGEDLYKTLQETMPEDVAQTLHEKNSISLSLVLKKHRDQVYPSGRRLCAEDDKSKKQLRWSVIDTPEGSPNYPQEKSASGEDLAGSTGSCSIRGKFSEKLIPGTPIDILNNSSRKVEGVGELPALPAIATTVTVSLAGRLPANSDHIRLGLAKLTARGVPIKLKATSFFIGATDEEIRQVFKEMGFKPTMVDGEEAWGKA